MCNKPGPPAPSIFDTLKIHGDEHQKWSPDYTVFLQRPITYLLLNLNTFLSTLTRKIHRQQQ